MVDEEGADIFEITDFTTATDFERFVSRLEEVIHEWKLTQEPIQVSQLKAFDLLNCEWSVMEDDAEYMGIPFTVAHHFIKIPRNVPLANVESSENIHDMKTSGPHSSDGWPTTLMSLQDYNHDFPTKSHIINRWFGITDFLVLSPKSCTVSDQNVINMALSAVKVAIQNSSCAVPIFVQALEEWRKFYLGAYQSSCIETTFEMVHLFHIPEKLRHLNGLLDVFKGKMNVPVNPSPKVLVSVRFAYRFPDWQQLSFSGSSFHPEQLSPMSLPFGATEDPINDILLFTTWSNISEDVVTENNIYSDLDPLQAPSWTVRVTMATDTTCILNESLMNFVKICSSSSTFNDILHGEWQNSVDADSNIANALDRMVGLQDQYNLNTITKKATRFTRSRMSSFHQLPQPLIDSLNDILTFIFPDANETASDDVLETENPDKDLFRYLKTAPLESPLYRLAVVCCIINGKYGLKAVAYIWNEFILELRYRVENSILISGVEHGSPNLGLGILYQKLQMLNCCIEKKSKRQEGTQSDVMEGRSNNDSGSDEEFFDATSDSAAVTSSSMSSKSLYEDSIQYKPQGRLSKLDDEKLLKVDVPLYIPVTQEPAPMTEDALAEHAEILTRLGSSAEGQSLRAKMQSASLLSDMESFKAANPGCVLEDFVRWYSPRDYIEEVLADPETGDKKRTVTLSDRMSVPGNMWQEVWENAKPIPAHRQKRLFDDTKEAEKVFHYLVNLTPAQVVLHLLPLVCQAAIVLLKSADVSSKMASVLSLLDMVTSQLEKISRLTNQSSKTFLDVISLLKSAELLISKAQSLHQKFLFQREKPENSDVTSFVFNLMEQDEVKVIGGSKGPVGQTIISIFSSPMNDLSSETVVAAEQSSESLFPSPTAREYILRANVPRPAPYSRILPQKMYCTLIEGDYRLAAAFSSDTTFY